MRALICGAGIAGLTLAWWLDRDGWSVTLVERRPSLPDDGYMIDFFGTGFDVCERMGLRPALERIAYPIDEVVFADADGRNGATLDYARIRALLDGRLLSLMRGELERVLYEARPAGVEVRFGTTIESLHDEGETVRARTSDGEVGSYDLVVGADGIHSHVRALAFGEEAQFTRYLGYQTAAYIFHDDDLHAQLGGRFPLAAVPGRQAGLYPIRGGRVATFFVHEAPDPRLPDDRCAALRAIYAPLGGVVPAALHRCDPATLYFDQVAQIEMPRWHRGRVVLVGDACQAVSLLAGQGASLAAGGAYVLAASLRAANVIGDGLRRYEQRMQPAVAEKQKAGRNTAAWIIPGSRWRLLVRGAALRLAGLPGLSRVLAPLFLGGAGSILREGE